MFILAGDCNYLNTEFLSTDFGFHQLLTIATHGNNLIDKVFVSHPDIYQYNVISLLKTKHMAVILFPLDSGAMFTVLPRRRKVSVFDLRKPYIFKLRHAIGAYDWNLEFYDVENIDTMYSNFLSAMHSLIAFCIPKNTPTPALVIQTVTPLIKVLLNKRNRLCRRGKIEAANNVACKIDDIIVSIRSRRLINAAYGSTKDLWAQVKIKE